MEHCSRHFQRKQSIESTAKPRMRSPFSVFAYFRLLIHLISRHRIQSLW